MRNLIIGIVVGVVIGVVAGTTVIAPRLDLPATLVVKNALEQPPKSQNPAFDETHTPPRSAPKRIAIGAPRAPLNEPAPSAAMTVKWRMASAFSGDLPQIGDMAKRIEQLISSVSDGRVDIKFHEPGSLVPPEEMLEAVRAGAISAAFGTPATWSDEKPAFALFTSIPFGPPATEYMAWFFGGGGREMLEQMYRKAGVHGLICGALTTEGSGWFKAPIRVVGDLRGLRLAYTGLAGKVVAKLGAQVSTMALTDIPAALRSGLIDGAEASQPTIDFGLELHRLAAHYYFPGWHQPVTFLDLIVNFETWERLSKNQKSQIETVCGDNIRYGLALGETLQFEALKRLTAEGVRIETWPPEILDAFRAAWRQVVAEQVAGNREFKTVWQALSRFREDFAIWREISRP